MIVNQNAAAGTSPDANERQGAKAAPERVPAFIPTPERLSQYLERDVKEVIAQMESVDGRQKLYDELLTHEADLKESYDDFHPDTLRERLDLAGETLTQKKKYLEEMNAPEKKGMFRRAWEAVKAFPKKHPVVTTVLIAALAVAAVAGGFYLAGSWEVLLSKVGLSKILGAEGATEAAKQVGNIITSPEKWSPPTGM